MRLFNNMKLRTKLWLIGGIVVLGFVIITMQSLVSVKSKMLEEKRIKTMHLVESAYGVLDHFYKRTQAGSMTEKDAQAAAVAVLNELRYDKKEYFFIHDLEPKIVLNPVRPEYVGKNASEIKDARGVQIYLEFVAIAKKDGAGFSYYEQKKPDVARPLPKLSYVKLFSPWGWVIGTGIYIDDVEAAFWTKEFWITTGKMAFTGIIIIFCILGFAAVVSASIFKQLGAEPSEVAEVVKTVAKGDLSVAITPKHGDTTSLLANMKDMVGQLKGMIGNIKSASMSVETGSGQLLATAGEISRGLETQSGKVAQIAAASEEMSQTIVDIAKNSVDMASSASTANAVAKAGEDIVRKSIEEVKVTAVTMSESAQKIQELGERSKQISKIVDVINNLADQTNLLALNAAIEAARAGEQGRGFAVVANEVRQLAERTAKATSEISAMVTAIQEDVGKAVFSMDGATKQVQAGVERSTEEGEALRKIVKSVGDLQATVQHIATSTEQMSATAEQISGDIQAIANSSKEITAESGRVSQESTDLATVAGNLEQVVGRFKL